MAQEHIEVHVEVAAKQAGGILRSRFGAWALAAISFAESSLLVPIITDPFMVAYMLANKGRGVRAVVVTTAASVVGGVAAYFMAYGFFELVAGQFLVGKFHTDFAATETQMREGTFVATLVGAFTPLPYTIVAYAAGVLKANLWIFIAGSIIGRSARYALVGWFTYRFGERALAAARKRILLVSLIVFVCIILYILRYVFERVG